MGITVTDARQVSLSTWLSSAPQHLSYSEAEIRQEAVKLPRTCGQPEDRSIIHNCRAFRKTLLDGLSSNNGWGSGNHPQKPGFTCHQVKRLIVTLMATDHKLVYFKSSSTSKPLWIKQDTHPLENCCGMFHYPNGSINSPKNPMLVPNSHHRIKDVFA